MQDFYGGDDPKIDPFLVAKRWIDAAIAFKEAEPTAVNLASVDEAGMPDVRVVYVRELVDDGFVFYTNYESQKGRELASGKAAMNYYFPLWRRQIRLRGLVEKVSEEKSDAYFLARPEGSRLGAWMSQQSRPVASRAQMEAELQAVAPERADLRPPHWGGYVLKPLEMEFWAMGEYRVHDRFLWSRDTLGSPWQTQRLYP